MTRSKKLAVDFAFHRRLRHRASEGLHGAVRLHSLASSPTPKTQGRVASALAGMDYSARKIAPMAVTRVEFFVLLSLGSSGIKSRSSALSLR
jgi:hypothetical protein